MSARVSEEGGVFGVSEELVQSPMHKQAATKLVDFDGLLRDSPLRLHEDLSAGNGGRSKPYRSNAPRVATVADGLAGQTWPAGHVLAKYLLLRMRDTLKHKSMLE